MGRPKTDMIRLRLKPGPLRVRVKAERYGDMIAGITTRFVDWASKDQ